MDFLGIITFHIAIMYMYKSVYKFIYKDFNILGKLFSVAALGLVIFLVLDKKNPDLVANIVWTLFATFLIWQIAQAKIKLDIDVSRKFKSEPKDINRGESYLTPIKFREPKQFTNDDIPFYVRFTLWEIIKSGDKGKMIFDSSDFSVINGQFGTFDGIQQIFQVGGNFDLDNISYCIDLVRVDMINIFDDYSLGHSKSYHGVDIPYNIQVIVELKRK